MVGSCRTCTAPSRGSWAIPGPDRHEYVLTPKGADLYPILLSLMAWGDEYENDVPPVRLVHRGCGHAAEPRVTCAHCGEPVGWRDMTAEFEPGAW
ncbi:winged helix-turn-helix transcriptional regulator [Pseudonocardia sp. KRD-184]|uniref:Winged helix-turn-helix transcriptional regulator n=1 Tax=Pseudonocardia oceani TaxID=2792013 RepID=A0ABS6U8Y4_9PSEU|nr:winged helix-turn-helix transcriptional regulator [Pseudonocardia oceani]MBW0088663.1 winged helix-turn-helix transcriptional regulator [Pseudonocardia oceani]MBW0095517.1 winged helix-turn-helix transcriptional regulator [Pseudonocardia oceani]MBW0108502.1 winged helix-turn-helix transcriptional regulator [Pseudonocardia oceani]MBW0121528.1 winged helix-turn-helix transcriptional regulator [Pseudonocardia oceani]MBW0128709.1 winged helix-turn-helix transcriptional regulator [Pseudonocardia